MAVGVKRAKVPMRLINRASWRGVNAVYALIREARDMLALIPDADLAAAKRELGVLEDLLWQAVEERR